MAQEKKTIHQYKLSAKLDDGKLTIWVSDAVTKKRWESEFNKDSFPGKNLKEEIFPIIKKAVTSKPACWAATYPQEEGQNLYIDVEDGALEFELPEVEFDPDDLF